MSSNRIVHFISHIKHHQYSNKRVLLTLGCMLFLASCQHTSPAAQTVEAYLDALTSKNLDRVAVLVCPDFEDQAIMDIDAFQLVSPTLENVQCSETEQLDGIATVKCSGKIITTYNNETSDINLEERTFRVINERGDWFVCGFQ